MEEELDNVNMFEQDESPLLDFGRHKGRTYLDVALNEPHYCAWASQLEEPQEKMAAFVEWLREHQMVNEPERDEQDDEEEVDETNDAGSQILGFGRHHGRTYMDVAINEPGWCRAVREMSEKDAEIQRFVDWLDTFEQDEEAVAASGETEVEADNFEYWVEREEHEAEVEAHDGSNHHELDDEMEGIAHTEPSAFAHAEACWDSSEGSVDDDAAHLWRDENSCGASACEDVFAAFGEDHDYLDTFIQEDCTGKRVHEDMYDGSSDNASIKRARTAHNSADDVMLALTSELNLTPPRLELQ